MFENLKDKRLFEKIVDQITDAVLLGSLKVGDKLPSEPELARIFGVSRAGVREALRVLELSGLVVIKKGNQGGCFIQELSSNQKLIDYLSDNWRLGQITLAHLIEARYWLESMVIDIVGQRITDKDIDKLRKSMGKAEHLCNEGGDREKVDEHLNFHISLARITGNTILVDTLSAILELLSYMLRKIRQSRRITVSALAAHRKILDLLEARQIERAQAVNKAHLKDIATRLIKLAAKTKEPTEPETGRTTILRKEESHHV